MLDFQGAENWSYIAELVFFAPEIPRSFFPYKQNYAAEHASSSNVVSLLQFPRKVDILGQAA
jgi:hypothetical protein